MVYIDERVNDFDLEGGLREISHQRREQALRFRSELGQRTCVLAYLLLKRALREEYGLMENPVFEYGEHGKPYIVGHPGIFFSLSHCKEAVACIVASRPVGIDVESADRYSERVARFAMNSDELKCISESENHAVAFIRLWTQKEARMKQLGIGISNGMKDVLGHLGGSRLTTVERLEKNYIYTVCEE